MCKQRGCEIFYVKLMNYYYFEKKKETELRSI